MVALPPAPRSPESPGIVPALGQTGRATPPFCTSGVSPAGHRGCGQPPWSPRARRSSSTETVRRAPAAPFQGRHGGPRAVTCPGEHPPHPPTSVLLSERCSPNAWFSLKCPTSSGHSSLAAMSKEKQTLVHDNSKADFDVATRCLLVKQRNPQNCPGAPAPARSTDSPSLGSSIHQL